MSNLNIHERRPVVARFVAAMLLCCCVLAPATVANPRFETPSPAVRVAPPAPVFTEAERRAEVTKRRAEVAERIGAGNVLVLFSAEPKVYTGDVDYEFRQENNFYYLTNLRQENAVLVMLPGVEGVREVLFMPKRNARTETWTGRMYAASEAAALSGVEEIWARDEFDGFMRSLGEGKIKRPQTSGVLHEVGQTVIPNENSFTRARAANTARLFMLAPAKDRRAQAREWMQEGRFADAWERSVKDFPVESAWNVFGQVRLRKSPMEQRLLQHAVDITTEGLGRAMATAGRLAWEYEVEAEVEYTFKRRGADYWGYPSIVGCGANATTLHYWDTRGRVASDELLLMDTGAEFDHYTADVTRTFPVSGRFTLAQTEIYNIVLAAQEAGMRAVKHNAKTSDVHQAAQRVLREGLFKLGLTVDANSDQHVLWSIHGTSHWLGMNVHDVGDYESGFAPGMIFTIEPGIYIRPDALDNLPDTKETRDFIQRVRPAFERYKNIGVRIEDDILITPEGSRNMSAKLPRTIKEIEAFIEQARNEVKLSQRSLLFGDAWRSRSAG